MSQLSELLNAANRQSYSTRTIEREAAKLGHKLSYSTASKYLAGKHGEPTQDVLEAFADVFRLDVAILREAAGLASLGEPFELPPEASRLNSAEREAIWHVVRVMIESRDKRAGKEHVRSAPMNEAGEQPAHERFPDTHRELPKEYLDLAAGGEGGEGIQGQREADELGEDNQDVRSGDGSN